MQRKLTVIIACIVIVASAWFLWSNFKPSSRGDYRPLLNGIGAGIAEATVQTAKGQGRIVVVVDAAQAQAGAPANLPLSALRSELEKHSSLSLGATEIIPELVVEDRLTPSCPFTAFKEILQRHAAATVIVFLVPVPEWSRASGGIPTGASVRLVVLDSATQQLKPWYAGYFANGILSTLIIPRRDATGVPPAASRLPLDQFRRDFQVFTHENSETLPE